MAHATSAQFSGEEAVPQPRSDLSAATGIMVALALSVGFWAALAYAVRAVAG
ncbi:hypothetical protein ACFQU7_21635 [Pseudoroseomonas wenyumeiae]